MSAWSEDDTSLEGYKFRYSNTSKALKCSENPRSHSTTASELILSVRKEAHRNAENLQELYRLKTQLHIEQVVREQLTALIREHQSRFHRERRLCKEAGAELTHWKEESDKLAVARKALQKQVKALRESVISKRLKMKNRLKDHEKKHTFSPTDKKIKLELEEPAAFRDLVKNPFANLEPSSCLELRNSCPKTSDTSSETVSSTLEKSPTDHQAVNVAKNALFMMKSPSLTPGPRLRARASAPFVSGAGKFSFPQLLEQQRRRHSVPERSPLKAAWSRRGSDGDLYMKKKNLQDRLFCDFLVIGSNLEIFSPDARSNKLNASMSDNAQILYRYPGGVSQELKHVVEFAFPSGNVNIEQIDATKSASNFQEILFGQRQFKKGRSCHVFVFKEEAKLHRSDNVYGVCVRMKEAFVAVGEDGIPIDMVTELAFCALSRHPFFQLHFDMINRILGARRLYQLNHMSSNASLSPVEVQRSSSRSPKESLSSMLEVFYSSESGCISILEDFYKASVPDCGDSIQISIPYELPLVSFVRPSNEADAIVSWSCSLPWSSASAHALVQLLDIALREYKLIVVCPNLALTSASVFSLYYMLSPLVWSGILLPILPESMGEFLQAPVPLIAGVTRLPENVKTSTDLDEDTAVWFPDQGIIWKPRSSRGKMPFSKSLLTKLDSRLKALSTSPPESVVYSCNLAQDMAVKNVLELIRQQVEAILKLASSAENLKMSDSARLFMDDFNSTQMLSHFHQMQAQHPIHQGNHDQ